MKSLTEVKHVVNGDEHNGWYCYGCEFFSRNVEEAAKHDGTTTPKETFGLDMIPETLPEMVERVTKDPFDPHKLNRPCYRCGAPYGAHANTGHCPEGNWYSKTDTFLDLGPAHDQWVTGDRNC